MQNAQQFGSRVSRKCMARGLATESVLPLEHETCGGLSHRFA